MPPAQTIREREDSREIINIMNGKTKERGGLTQGFAALNARKERGLLLPRTPKNTAFENETESKNDRLRDNDKRDAPTNASEVRTDFCRAELAPSDVAMEEKKTGNQISKCVLPVLWDPFIDL